MYKFIGFIFIFYILFTYINSLRFPAFSPINADTNCAVYSCNTEKYKDICAINELDSTTNYTKAIYLNENVCKDDEYCDIGGKPNEVFYNQGKIIKGKCKKNTPGITIMQRYPGEKCEEDSDCFNTTSFEGKCNNETKKCEGYELYHKCKDHSDCVAGMFCESEKSGRCYNQRKEYEDCKSTYECENKLLCYEGQCQDIMFKIPVGTILNKTKISEQDLSNIPLEYYCEYGLINEKTKTCVSFGYINPEDNLEQVKKECKRGDKCLYVYYPLSEGSFELDCGCAYGEEGKGYCPLPHTVDRDKWEKFFAMKEHMFDNNCHTLSRYDCYDNELEMKQVFDHANDQLNDGNVYYKSVNCAKKVFDNTN